MKKIVTVIGARPQFIKASPVSKAFSNCDGIKEILVHTGQHYDSGMSKVFFDELEISEPQYNLGVGSGSHAFQTGEIMKRLEEALLKEKPDLVLIYGDTNSTLAGALTAVKLHIPVAHVEAGMRSFNMKMAEEINRIVADRLSSILFAPTRTAVENLKKEGITEEVYRTGDVMYDVAIQFSEKVEDKTILLNKFKIKPKEYILCTIHRAENSDDKLRLTNILTVLNEISIEIPVILPLHPRTKKMADKFGLKQLFSEITTIEPLGFIDMILLEHNAKLIITDSGGVQKEAYFHKVPCVTLREETEWVETVDAGWNMLADVSLKESIYMSVQSMIDFSGNRMDIDEYGDGKASGKIANIILQIMPA